jgi:nucleotide-binding universal stress UspA family protein
MEGREKMLCSKVLVAYDDSDLAKRSLEKALEIAKTNPVIEIQVVHVIKIPAIARTEMDNFQALEDAIYQEGKDIIAKVELALSKLPNHSKAYLLVGISPAYVILDHVKEYNCDLIIMGSRGLSGIKELLGSVSHTVVHHSQIPVLIIK